MQLEEKLTKPNFGVELFLICLGVTLIAVGIFGTNKDFLNINDFSYGLIILMGIMFVWFSSYSFRHKKFLYLLRAYNVEHIKMHQDISERIKLIQDIYIELKLRK